MSLTSIVIVNWNTKDLVERCVAAVRRATLEPYELILVDNGSHDGSAESIESLAGSGARAVLLPGNLGFAAGSNRGIAEASGDAVCLLNTDATVTRGWLGSLRRTMDRREAGMAGPYTDHAKGPQRRKPWFGRWPPPFRRTREVVYLSFFCVVITRAVIDAVGLLDERFGLGTFEDDDYCRRAKEKGFRLVIDGGSYVWHEAHGTFRRNRLDDRALQDENRRRFDEKWAE